MLIIEITAEETQKLLLDHTVQKKIQSFRNLIEHNFK